MTIQQNRGNIGLAKILIFWVNNFLIHFNILVGANSHTKIYQNIGVADRLYIYRLKKTKQCMLSRLRSVQILSRELDFEIFYELFLNMQPIGNCNILVYSELLLWPTYFETVSTKPEIWAADYFNDLLQRQYSK